MNNNVIQEITSCNKSTNKLTGEERSRLFSVILYPDDPSHKDAIDLLSSTDFPSVGILHDKDTKTDPETGEVITKKPHYHFLICFKNARKAKNVAEKLNITLNYMRLSYDFTLSARYLLHLDSPNKTKYDVNELVGALALTAAERMGEKSDGSSAREVINLIYSFNYPITVTQFVHEAAQRGLWSEIRRGAYWFRSILYEHNEYVCSQKYRYYERQEPCTLDERPANDNHDIDGETTG